MRPMPRSGKDLNARIGHPASRRVCKRHREVAVVLAPHDEHGRMNYLEGPAETEGILSQESSVVVESTPKRTRLPQRA